MTVSFKPALYQDDYKERLLEAIEAKIRGQELLPLKDNQPNQVSSLFDALEQSLKQTAKKSLKTSDNVIEVEGKEVKKTRARTIKKDSTKTSKRKIKKSDV